MSAGANTEAKVVGLDGEPVENAQQGEPEPRLVEMLEDLLGLAKSGKIQSLCGAGFTCDGHRYTVWATTQDAYRELGSLGWLQQEYIARVTGLCEDE